MADCYIGIDTSNYTTSVALASEEGEILANLKAPLPVKAGERGLRQSDAVFAHVKNLPTLMQELRSHLKGNRVLAVGVSTRPRDAEDSYMPCFLSGRVAAESLASGLDVPVEEFSHQNGHVMAALYGADVTDLIGEDFLAFHVSGGTTEMLLVRPRERDFEIELIGGTADLNAGQVVDRIGVAMGLSFPCGPALELLAKENTKKVPKPRVCVKEGTCNLSGLENMALKLLADTGDKSLAAAFVLEFIAETLAKMTAWGREQYPDIPVLFAGGVMSNRLIAENICKRFENVYFSTPAFSADNAAGIALLCRAKYQKDPCEMARYSKQEICGIDVSKFPVLTEEEKRDLLQKSRAGDAVARDVLICGSLSLVYAIIARFSVFTDELFAVGHSGLLKAVDAFDLNWDMKFSTYAVPMIIAEIRRYLREKKKEQ